jgi:hypothetical protein
MHNKCSEQYKHGDLVWPFSVLLFRSVSCINYTSSMSLSAGSSSTNSVVAGSSMLEELTAA